MEQVSGTSVKAAYLPIIVLNTLGLLFVYLVPSFSHWLAWPVYLLEPMRWVVILALLHTHRYNAYVLAVSLPIFSMLTLGHPVVYKSFLIAFELVINVAFFLYLKEKMKSNALALGIAVLASKILYYMAKFAFISVALISGSLISSPLYFQAIVLVGISAYAFFFSRKH